MMGDWTFFSNYGHVLVCLARDREMRLRDVAVEVGITERAVQKIVRDMQDTGFITVSKQGRCNRYQINRRKALRHGLESQVTVGKLLALVGKPASPAKEWVSPEEAIVAEADPAPAAARPAPKPTPAPKAVEKPIKPDEEVEQKPAPAGTREQGSLF
jgi:hypothetical protein